MASGSITDGDDVPCEDSPQAIMENDLWYDLRAKGAATALTKRPRSQSATSSDLDLDVMPHTQPKRLKGHNSQSHDESSDPKMVNLVRALFLYIQTPLIS